MLFWITERYVLENVYFLIPSLLRGFGVIRFDGQIFQPQFSAQSSLLANKEIKSIFLKASLHPLSYLKTLYIKLHIRGWKKKTKEKNQFKLYK